MSKFGKLYLLAYNSLQTFCWTLALIRILRSFLSTNSIRGSYASAGDLISVLQTAAFLEILHGAIGIVPTGVLSPLMQWGGRTHFMLAILKKINEIHESPSVFITFAAWSLGEVIRYPHYALNSMGTCPSWLTYLRYTAFILVYPIGVGGEMWLMYHALPYIKSKNLYANTFAGLPFSYYDFVRVVLLSYPFLWLKLYLYLFKQRRSKLGHRRDKRKRK